MSGTTIASFSKQDHTKNAKVIQDGGGCFFLGGERPGGPRDEDQDDRPAFQCPITGLWAHTHSAMDNLNVRCSCGLLDPFEPWGDKFCFQSINLSQDKGWWVPPNERPKPEGNVDQGLKHYRWQVANKHIPPERAGPRERLRQETFVTLVFVGQADEEAGDYARCVHLVMTMGPGGVGDRYEGSATICIEAGASLLAAEEADGAKGLRPGVGTPTYHLAHLGFLDRLKAVGFRFKMKDGPPSHEFIISAITSTMPIGTGATDVD